MKKQKKRNPKIISDEIIVTEEELTILIFSMFANYPWLYWADKEAWIDACSECQDAVIEQKREQLR